MTLALTKSDKLSILLRILVWLNVLDSVLTLSVVGLRWASESNPLMSYFLQRGPIIFGTVKMSLTIIGSLVLWKGRASTWALPGTSFLVACYALLVSYEVLMIIATIGA